MDLIDVIEEALIELDAGPACELGWDMLDQEYVSDIESGDRIIGEYFGKWLVVRLSIDKDGIILHVEEA